MSYRLYLLPAVILGLLLPLSGCGPRSTSVPQHSVKGQVLYKGQPAAGVLVVLHPSNPIDKAMLPPRGTTQSDGSFVVGSRLTSDGAPAGDYDVTLIWPEDQDPDRHAEDTPPDRLKNRYNDATHAKWHVHVGAQDNTLETFVIE
jgi:hypothetical protein